MEHQAVPQPSRLCDLPENRVVVGPGVFGQYRVTRSHRMPPLAAPTEDLDCRGLRGASAAFGARACARRDNA